MSTRLKQAAWLLILIADAGLLMWGAMAALLAIAVTATAFRRGYRWAWWALLVGNTIAFGAAMTYDRIVSAIGPFEMSEYLGIGVIYAALAITAPFLAAGRPVRSTG